MLRYLSLIVCACVVGQGVAYSRPAVLGTSPLAANRVKIQPAVTVEYLVQTPRVQYGLPAPGLAYGAPAPVPGLGPYGAPALAPVLNRVVAPVSYAQPAPAPALYGALAPRPLPALGSYGAPVLAPVLNRAVGPVSYAQTAPGPIYGAPALGPRAPAVDSESIALANLALSLPSAGGPIVGPIPIASSGLANLY